MANTNEILPNLPSDLFFLTDPYQTRALQQASLADHAWIYGSDEKKRLEVMAQMVINNVFEGNSTLVCASPDSEFQLTKLLDELGLDCAYFNLRGSISNAALASLQLARKKAPKDDVSERAHLALSQYNSWKEKLAGQHSAMHRQVFGDLTWTQLADKASTGPEQTYKSLLSASLKASDFELSIKEYWHVRGRIKTFQRLRVLRTPGFDLLNKLHSLNFTEGDETALRQQIIERLDSVVYAGRSLLGRIGELVHHYRRDISGEHYHVLHELTVEIDRIEELLDRGIAMYGNDFVMESTFAELTAKFRRSMSRKYREIHADREVVIHAFNALLKHLETSPFSTSDQVPWTDSTSMEELRENLTAMRTWLSIKAKEIETLAITNKKRLNASNISSTHALQKDIRFAEKEIEEFVSKLNQARIFEEHFEINALSLEKRSHVIKTIVSDSLRLIEAMPDFEAYYLWRNFWIQQPPHIHTLLESLDILEDNDQTHAFDSWYFENILDRLPLSHMVNGPLPSRERKNKLSDLRSIVLQYIRTQLQKNRHEVLRSIKSTAKNLHSAIGSSKRSTTSDELQCLQATALSKLFPVVFCTPGQLRDYGYYFSTLVVSDTTGGDFKLYQAQGNKCVMVTKSIPSNAEALSSDLAITRLNTTTLTPSFEWNKLPASDRLFHLNALASQFLPFTDTLNIYNCRNIQIFSFLGEIADQSILAELSTPYKRQANGGSNEVRHITESFLDASKPIVLLTRDGIMGYEETCDLFWQDHVLQAISSCGVPVIDQLSLEIKSKGKGAILEIAAQVIEISNSYNTPLDSGKAVSA